MFEKRARPQNLWAHREDISSRQAAKNAKDSAALFGNPIDGAGNSMLMDLHRNVNNLPPALVLRHSSYSIGVLGVFASWREQKIDPEKTNPKKCVQPPLFFPAYHTLGTLSERYIYPQISRKSQKKYVAPESPSKKHVIPESPAGDIRDLETRP